VEWASNADDAVEMLRRHPSTCSCSTSRCLASAASRRTGM
jgi:hypothetical protein